ncbi:MAG TPA: molecular chaperone DnaJ [Caulobacter sp.]|nr:molecular chaperone DnaJ [Caulobacter sp.]
MDPRRARAVLGLRGPADEATLRSAFRRGVKATHPDRPGGDAGRLREVVEAYELLKAAPAAAPTPAPSPAPTSASAPKQDVLEISPALAAFGGEARVLLADGRRIAVSLPAGLRNGDRVRAGEALLTVAVRWADGLALRGDDLWLTADLPDDAPWGGRLPVETPAGPRAVWIDRRALKRGLVRLSGAGLPARGPHAVGDLIVRLRQPQRPESASRGRLKAFAAAWAPAAVL